MGFYIETPHNNNKARYLIDTEGAVEINRADAFDAMEEGCAVICVVDNGAFEAAAYVDSIKELIRFSRADNRPKVWLKMDRKRAEELVGFSKL